jgi:hypothetical protein
VLSNIVKTNRSLRQPWPGTIILASEGCGSDKITKLALLITKFATRNFNVTLRNFMLDKWHFDLKALMTQIALDPKPLVCTFEEKQLTSDEVLGDLDALMAHGELISLFTAEELIILCEKLRMLGATTQQVTHKRTNDEYIDEVKTALRENLKVMFTLTPASTIYRIKMRSQSHLLNCSTVIYMGDWGDTGLELVAEQVLGEKINKGYEEGE